MRLSGPLLKGVHSAAWAVALEPLSWWGAGTVSRLRDHADKRLPDYASLAHEMVFITISSCGPSGCNSSTLFEALVDHMMRVYGTNLSLGSLLMLSLHVAPLSRIRSDERVGLTRLSETALREAMSFPMDTFLRGLRRVFPRYSGRMRCWAFPDLWEPFPRESGYSLWYASRIVTAFDPVLSEVREGWRVSRGLAIMLRQRIGCRVPGSEDVDWLYRRACARLGADYLSFRRRGLEKMFEDVRACSEGRWGDVGGSLGSVADIVAMSLFYYRWSCIGETMLYDRAILE